MAGPGTDNSHAAVVAFLERHRLAAVVEATFGRQDWMFPHQMKPDPFLLNIATIGNPPTSFVGDSVSNVQAAHAAHVPCIGDANKPQKVQTLTEAGADALITSMHELAGALNEYPCEVLPN